MKRISLVAMMAVAGLFSTNAMAADLGGDCCADLEERVAELEATTARKGNRKVSLTIYGHVNTAVMFWDNGNESNTYVVDNDAASTRFGLKGGASINSEWSAGYVIEIETESASSNSVSEDSDEGGRDIGIRQAYWSLKSTTLGQIRVGQQHTANSGIAEIDLGNTNLVALFDVKQGRNLEVHDANGVLGTVGSFVWGNGEFNNIQNVVRYDTPAMAGFVLSASWGEDDLWDVALRYAGEFGGFKVAAGIAYGETTDADNGGPGSLEELTEAINGSVSVLHMGSGLFVTFAAARDERTRNDVFSRERTFWGIKGGIYQKFFSVGKTSIYAEYRDYEVENSNFTEDEADLIGAGIVQSIDAAAMDLYLGYQHFNFDVNTSTTEEDVDVVMAGARIKF